MNKTNHSDFAWRRSLLSLTEPASRCLLSTQHCLTRSVHFTGIAFLPRQYRRGTVHRWASLTALQSPPRVLSIVARLIEFHLSDDRGDDIRRGIGRIDQRRHLEHYLQGLIFSRSAGRRCFSA